MAFLRVLALTLLGATVAEDSVTLLTFANGDPGYPFEVVNDPVMGGVSTSTYNVRQCLYDQLLHREADNLYFVSLGKNSACRSQGIVWLGKARCEMCLHCRHRDFAK